MGSKDRKQLAKQRRENARQAQKFHREQQKQKNKSSGKPGKKGSVSKIKEAVNAGRASKYEPISREEKFLREGDEKLRNLQPRDFEDGYYIDEYGEKKRQQKRAKVIRKQENEVIRRNKKPMTSKQIRIKRILISAGIVTAVLVIGVILSLTVLFKTEKIDVRGDIYYNSEQIEAFSNVNLQQNIFLGTLNSTPEEIVKNLPYVESATIRFSVPDTIIIQITNAVPAYAVKDGSGWLIVSSKGRILDTANFKTDDLVELKCGEIKNKTKGSYIDFGDENVSQILNSVSKSFAANGVDKITGFDITNLTQIVINYDNRIDINIGLPEDIDYKIKTAFAIINDKLDPNNTGTVTGVLDVSTCNKNKISRYKPASTTEPPADTSPTVPAADAQTGQNGYDYNTYDYNTYDYNTYDYNTYDYNTYDYGQGYDSYDYNTYDGNVYDWQAE